MKDRISDRNAMTGLLNLWLIMFNLAIDEDQNIQKGQASKLEAQL